MEGVCVWGVGGGSGGGVLLSLEGHQIVDQGRRTAPLLFVTGAQLKL